MLYNYTYNVLNIYHYALHTTHLCYQVHSPSKSSIFQTASNDMVMIWETYTDIHSLLQLRVSKFGKVQSWVGRYFFHCNTFLSLKYISDKSCAQEPEKGKTYSMFHLLSEPQDSSSLANPLQLHHGTQRISLIFSLGLWARTPTVVPTKIPLSIPVPVPMVFSLC